MRRVRRGEKKSQSRAVKAEVELPIDDGSAQLAMIQALIPLGLRAVEEALITEVNNLAGKRYAHEDGGSDVVRWGRQRGSVFIADQKLPIVVPRLRDRGENREISLKSYERFQTPRSNDLGLYRRVAAGISCRDYEAAAEAVPEAFGVAKSSVSRRFVRASAGGVKYRINEPREPCCIGSEAVGDAVNHKGWRSYAASIPRGLRIARNCYPHVRILETLLELGKINDSSTARKFSYRNLPYHLLVGEERVVHLWKATLPCCALSP